MGKTHVIDGVTYVEVERKAEVGDMIWLANVRCELRLCDYNDIDAVNEDIINGDVQVLEPLDALSTTQASPSVVDIIANLARRVTSLEQQLRDTQRNVERQAEELENAKHRIRKHEDMFAVVEERVGMLTDDVITLDERTQVINAITKFYDGGER